MGLSLTTRQKLCDAKLSELFPLLESNPSYVKNISLITRGILNEHFGKISGLRLHNRLKKFRLTSPILTFKRPTQQLYKPPSQSTQALDKPPAQNITKPPSQSTQALDKPPAQNITKPSPQPIPAETKVPSPQPISSSHVHASAKKTPYKSTTFSCKICSRVFSSGNYTGTAGMPSEAVARRAMETHQQSHNQPTWIDCEHCDYSFKEKDYKNHFCVFACHVCEKEFPAQQYQTVDIARRARDAHVHSSHTEFTCHVCGKEFPAYYYQTVDIARRARDDHLHSSHKHTYW